MLSIYNLAYTKSILPDLKVFCRLMSNTSNITKVHSEQGACFHGLKLKIKAGVVFSNITSINNYRPATLKFHKCGQSNIWHAFCTFIQHVQGRYNIVRKVCKVEILIGKMFERGASFLSFSGNMKKWRQHGKMDTTLDQNILWLLILRYNMNEREPT